MSERERKEGIKRKDSKQHNKVGRKGGREEGRERRREREGRERREGDTRSAAPPPLST